jgi:2-keto-4-pentenoate hydratase/2-oxohepta-3-ene-1,7-dioic acid hydratase in catechol pathway
MKIFAVAGAYDAAPSVDVALPLCDNPVWYEIPDSSISRSGNPFFVPDTGSDYVAFPSVAYRICKLGKSVATRFASRYYDAATLGFSVVAVDILRQLRAAGLPWARAVAFDRSCLLGNFMPISAFTDLEEFHITCGDTSTSYRCNDVSLGIDAAISLISADNTIKTGDIILPALSPAGLPLKIGDRFTVTANDSTIFDINVK